MDKIIFNKEFNERVKEYLTDRQIKNGSNFIIVTVVEKETVIRKMKSIDSDLREVVIIKNV